MKASQAAIDLIKEHEGCRLDAYLCPAGKPSIGYGHTGGVEIGQSITPKEAEDLLRSDLERFEQGVSAALMVPVTQSQFDALVCFAYNVGLAALRASTLLKRLNAGDAAGAADEFLRWNKAKGHALPGLTKRRKAERALFLTKEEATDAAA